jgi:hypothetical protein
MQRLVQGSYPVPTETPSSALMRFSKDSNSLQLRMGSKVGSGVFYAWHPADEAAAASAHER